MLPFAEPASASTGPAENVEQAENIDDEDEERERKAQEEDDECLLTWQEELLAAEPDEVFIARCIVRMKYLLRFQKYYQSKIIKIFSTTN